MPEMTWRVSFLGSKSSVTSLLQSPLDAVLAFTPRWSEAPAVPAPVGHPHVPIHERKACRHGASHRLHPRPCAHARLGSLPRGRALPRRRRGAVPVLRRSLHEPPHGRGLTELCSIRAARGAPPPRR